MIVSRPKNRCIVRSSRDNSIIVWCQNIYWWKNWTYFWRI